MTTPAAVPIITDQAEAKARYALVDATIAQLTLSAFPQPVLTQVGTFEDPEQVLVCPWCKTHMPQENGIIEVDAGPPPTAGRATTPTTPPCDCVTAHTNRRHTIMGLQQKIDALEAETFGDAPEDENQPAPVWPENDDERAAFLDWQREVGEGDTVLGFRDWLAAADEDDEPETRDERADQLIVGQTYGEYGDDPADYVTITRVKHKGDTVKVKGTTRDGETTRRHDRDEVVALVVPVMAGPGILTPIDTTDNDDGVPVIIECDDFPFVLAHARPTCHHHAKDHS